MVVNPCFEVDISGVDITCNLTTGIINISGNSLSYPYHVYLYYNGNEFSDEFYNENIITIDSDILPGEYYAIVVDGNGQTGQTDTVTINSVASFDYEVLITGASPCLVANTGYGEVTNFTGGTPPFTYFWSTLDTTPSVSNLPAGGCIGYCDRCEWVCNNETVYSTAVTIIGGFKYSRNTTNLF